MLRGQGVEGEGWLGCSALRCRDVGWGWRVTGGELGARAAVRMAGRAVLIKVGEPRPRLGRQMLSASAREGQTLLMHAINLPTTYQHVHSPRPADPLQI